MLDRSVHLISTRVAVFTAAMLLASAASLWAQEPKAQKSTKAAAAKAEKPAVSSGKSGSQAIVVLVNDEPITGYEIEQRSRLMALNSNLTERVKENFKRLAAAESTNKQVRAILDEVVAKNPGKSREQIVAIFEERKKQFGLSLQHQALESARASALPQFRKEAQEELIDEHLKLQEAKKIGVEVSDADVKSVMKGIAERNKLSEEQFAEHVKGMGVDIATMRDRFKAQYAWREVIRRRFAAQIAITEREVDKIVASEAGTDTVELAVQKVTLALPGKLDQAALAKRYVEADALRRKFTSCKSMASQAQGAADAKFEDMKFVKPSAFAEPTRSMLLNAKDGDILPPEPGAGRIEIYAVCSRRAIKTDLKQREHAQAELQQREFEMLAKRHLRDLRQDAHIEYR
jgi:peptidyl-prolyl cis-trans isomerase SurA